MEFKGYPKTNRFNDLEVIVTEKIDGTNACIAIEDGKVIGCQSRSKVITPTDDNYGFAGWVASLDQQALVNTLGEGYHYGEWAGPGIQKNNHNLTTKMFFLFNVSRYQYFSEDTIVTVPLLYQGIYTFGLEDVVLDRLANSAEVDGYKPEGIIMYFSTFRQSVKYTFGGNKSKGN